MPHENPHDRKPLTGLKIVSLAINLPGPVAAARLRDLGSDVTKIEPLDGDPLARGCLPWFEALHKNVTVLRLDLKDESQRERVFTLLADTDLLLTSSRPAALERLGFAWNQLHPRFPHLCHVGIIGQSPPDHDRPGHDLTYQASLGLIEPPLLPRVLVADLAGAEEAVSAAIALLLARARTGEAQAASVSLAEAAARFALAHQYGLTAPGGLLGGGQPGYNIYETAEGFVAVAALEPHFASRLASELGLPTLSRERLGHAFQSRTADEWETWAIAHDLPIAAVRGLRPA